MRRFIAWEVYDGTHQELSYVFLVRRQTVYCWELLKV